jgi:peptide deformylase
MSVRPVLQLPAAVLTQPAAAVGGIDAAVRTVIDDLFDTMAASPACVGLAAPQIGVALRIFVVDVSGHRKARSCHGPFVLVNPEVVHQGAPEVAREGCMSVPDLTGDVARATEVVVGGLDAAGQQVQFHVNAFEARAVLHELDHLDGMVFLDRVPGPHAVFPRKVYR